MDAPGKRGKLRMRTSIDRLPEDARQALEEMIADPYNGMRYADMADEIEEMCGIRLSTSAIGRHAQRYMRDKKRVDIVLERMRIMAEYSRDHALPDVSRFINALIQDGLMRRILDGSEEFAEMDFEAALKYSIQAQRAAVYEYRYKDAACVKEEIDGESLADSRMEWLRGLMRDKPELMAEIEKSYNEAAREVKDDAGDLGDSGDDRRGGADCAGDSPAACGGSNDPADARII